jgi:hypothetical protein
MGKACPAGPTRRCARWPRVVPLGCARGGVLGRDKEFQPRVGFFICSFLFFFLFLFSPFFKPDSNSISQASNLFKCTIKNPMCIQSIILLIYLFVILFKQILLNMQFIHPKNNSSERKFLRGYLEHIIQPRDDQFI